MRRKKYSRPAVESETAFEQTSLACTTTEGVPDAVGKTTAIDGLTFVYTCEIDVSKGGNFDDRCDVAAFEPECVVPLS